jgi:hypothetical protein
MLLPVLEDKEKELLLLLRLPPTGSPGSDVLLIAITISGVCSELCV